MKRLRSFFVLFLFPLLAKAQLKADFSFDKSGGCSPLTVSFTNTTTGASANATYQWDLGNGNTSALRNTGAVYDQEKTYAITLTVRDGNQISSATKNITVYKKPTVDFSAAVNKGCLPLPVTFNAVANAGDGNMSSYYWDFGDGFVQQTPNAQIIHTYNVVQQPGVNLTVTNSYGCYNTISKTNVVDIKSQLTAGFHVDKNILCFIYDSVHFINTSAGPETLSYAWDFGDGNTSTAKNPSYAYNKKGIYTVKLTVTNSDGCTAVNTQYNYLNVASFKSDFSVPSVVCKNSLATFTNTSSPSPSAATWFVDGSPVTNNLYSLDYPFYDVNNHSIKLQNSFGQCIDSVTKTVSVKNNPYLTGFIADVTGICGSPVVVNFKDTTATAVKWLWNFGLYQGQSAQQNPSYTYNDDDYYHVYLTVTDAAGCSASVYQTVTIMKPSVKISSPDVSPNGEIVSCGPMNVHFVISSSESLTNYLWNFGDGTTSTELSPAHLYDKPGIYYVSLAYTTVNGCKGVATISQPVAIHQKPKVDFTASSLNVCGNTPVLFTNTTTGFINSSYFAYYMYWNFGDGGSGLTYNQSQNVTHQFTDSGIYTVSLIISDLVCADTMIKTGYIKVLPPFPKITSFLNTCDGTRGMVTLNQNSKYANSYVWDFGDGATLPLTTNQPQVQHLYNKTGSYKVVLSTTNAQCVVRDSVYVPVLLKQHPVLSADKAQVCSTDDFLNIKISNLEKNPSPYYYYDYGYSYGPFQYSDGVNAPMYVSGGDLSSMPFNVTLSDFIPGEQGLYAVVRSDFFNCLDTTNTIPLKIGGPISGFKIVNKQCTTGNSVYLQDISKTQGGIPIVSWEWTFGDGTPTVKYSSNAEVSHSYMWPNNYQVTLKVTDANGCYSYVRQYVDASNNSLKASFTPSATTVAPGTAITFTNTSITSDVPNTSFLWVFGDGTQANSYNVTNTYNQPGTYKVTLVETNTLKGCSDTTSVTITVKYVNAAFVFNSSFINAAKCPPVLVQFSNISSNIYRIHWDFGDGTTSEQFNPNHIYTQAGKYIVTVNTYSNNGTMYTTLDSVNILAPTTKLSADVLSGCTAQNINFSASSQNTAGYMWDFGDGSVQQGTDSFSTHYYGTAGIYHPGIIVTDKNGCAALVHLNNNVIIDSLNLSLKNLPASICTPKQVIFDPVIGSAAPQQNFIYHWDFGTGNSADTSNIKTPSFSYVQPGSYNVHLWVQSSYGCFKEVTTVISASQGLGGIINGPLEICQGTPAQFSGATQLQGQPQWQWNFPDGTSAQVQNPPPKIFNLPGAYNIQLLVNNKGCIDSVNKTLLVNPNPSNILSAHDAIVCEGSSLDIVANGGNNYNWSPSIGLNNNTGSSVTATPQTDIIYSVHVTNEKGCSASDSIKLKVIHPFVLQLPSEVSVCVGSTLQLNASGAAAYQWINNTSALSNINISNPFINPSITTTYTVVAIDAYNCFKDTASITAVVRPLPVVDAGPGAEILAGTSYQLAPTSGNDVTGWKWSPSKYLSCNTCPSPVAQPIEPMVYTLTVNNAFGCLASDTVSIKLLCSDSHVFIPTSFTPNNDGKNDKFEITAQGIRLIKSLRIYNRWGELIFERSNFLPGDQNAAWNGKFKGLLVPVGTYVYFADLSCNENTYQAKGTITVVY